jgi:hypothetical protein
MAADPIDPVEHIYRAMEEENGLPRLGTSTTTLGVRRGKDIVPDGVNMVHRPAFLPNQPNGISCAPNIASLPRFALPVIWGGLNKRTVVWCLDKADLGAELVAQEDTAPGNRGHVSIGPGQSMSFDEYALAIRSTAAKWKIVSTPVA